MPRVLSDERRDLVKAIADFCSRECGTKEQRDKLTSNGVEHHNQQLYEKMAKLGWLGIAVPEEYGGAGRGMVDLSSSSRRRPTAAPPSAVSARRSSPPRRTTSSARRSRSAPSSKAW